MGKKSKLLDTLLPLFPAGITTFIDMFMGSGAVTFAMADQVKYIIANDYDNDVYNLFMVLKDRKKELEEAIGLMPVHETLFKHWLKKEETDEVWRAARFLMLSNYSYMGSYRSLRIDANTNSKAQLMNALKVFERAQSVKYTCCDFREMLPRIAGIQDEKEKSFIYADPPYLGTDARYIRGNKYKQKDAEDLFDLLVESNIKFGISEFDNPVILAMAERHGLQVTMLGERCNMKNRRTEIYISNYETSRRQPGLFD